MATLKVFPINTAKGQVASISYTKKDKIVTLEKNDIDGVYVCAKYTHYDKETNRIIYKTVNSTIDCSLIDVARDFKAVRKRFNKDSGNIGYHFIQNFGIEIDPKLANKIGREFVKKHCPGFQALISTHTNTGKIHNHIIINSVNMETGKKYYDNVESYRRARHVSDELCYKYGLPVLEDTKDYKIAKYKKDGKTHIFEPTERKLNISRGYKDKLNTPFNNLVDKESVRNADEIRSLIDQMIPSSKSFDDLVSKLKVLGCSVSDRTARGDYRKHVSYRLPHHGKATRDYKIGEFYIRENLDKFIKDNSKSLDAPTRLNDFVKETLAIDLNDPFKSDLHAKIHFDIKKISSEIDDKFWEAASVSYDFNNKVYKKIDPQTKKYLELINSNLRTIEFMNSEKVYTTSEILSKLNDVKFLRNATFSELNRANALLKEMTTTYTIIQDRKSNPVPVYEDILRRKGLTDSEKIDAFEALYLKSNQQYDILVNTLTGLNYKLIKYDDVVTNLQRLEKRKEINMINQELDEKNIRANEKLDIDGQRDMKR